VRFSGRVRRRLGPLFDPDDGWAPRFGFLLVAARIGTALLLLLPPALLAIPGLPLGGRYA
jgi:hypothetical protein